MGESHCLCGKSIDGGSAFGSEIVEVDVGRVFGKAFGDVVDGEGVVHGQALEYPSSKAFCGLMDL